MVGIWKKCAKMRKVSETELGQARCRDPRDSEDALEGISFNKDYLTMIFSQTKDIKAGV